MSSWPRETVPRSAQLSTDAWVSKLGDARTGQSCGWWGPLVGDEVALVAQAVRQDDYPHHLPDLPWAMAVRLPDGRVRVACHPMLDAGVFVTNRSDGAVAVALSLRAIHQAGGKVGTLDESWLRDHYGGQTDRHRSPIRGVARVPPGESATIAPGGSITRTVWCGPEVWPSAPDRRGPSTESAYREAFDDVTTTLVQHAGPLTASVSGGLDSTFVAASLARHGRQEPITALVHTPVEGFTAPQTAYVPDDLPWVWQMAHQYPGTFRFVPIHNDSFTHPMDAAAQRMDATWWPVFGVANSVWTQVVEQRAVDRGSTLIFGGFHGNASYSWHHGHASAYCIDHRQWADLYRIAARPNASVSQRWALLRRHVLGPLRHHSRAAGTNAHTRFLRFLAGRLTTHHAHPHGLELLRADPFRSRAVLTLAAQIHPSEWRRQAPLLLVGPDDRAFARRISAGRVPDPIRLRASRGLQSSDTWLWIHNSRGRILDEIDAISSNTLACELVDAPGLRSLVNDWHWADPTRPPPHGEVTRVLRDIAFADYCRTMPTRLAC